MKRSSIIAALLILSLFLISFMGCAQRSDKCNADLKIVCTVFPAYDWVRSIIKNAEGVSVSLIIQNGTDPHSYQPTAADVMTISDCDMIVYLGAESDKWVQEALERADNSDTQKISLTDIPQMTLHNISASSHQHTDHEDDHDHHDHGAFDEHIWLSLSNAITATKHIARKLSLADSTNADLYISNALSYIESLTELGVRYEELVSSTDEHHRFMLFADRFPFVYLLEELEINYSAAFEGCTADVDASFDTIIDLVEEAKLHSVSAITVTESSDKALAKAVARELDPNTEIIVMNSLQSVTAGQLKQGITYISVMEENLVALSRALSSNGE